MPCGFRINPVSSTQGPHPAGTWWAEAVKGGEQVQAGAAWVAGLGQAFIVIGLAAGARVARGTEAVKGAGGVEAGAAVFTGTGALLGWEERRGGSPQGQGWKGKGARLPGCLWWPACGDGSKLGKGLVPLRWRRTQWGLEG